MGMWERVEWGATSEWGAFGVPLTRGAVSPHVPGQNPTSPRVIWVFYIPQLHTTPGLGLLCAFPTVELVCKLLIKL